MRRKTKEISIGKVKIGGDNPIAVQSMTNTDTRDWQATVEQILQLEKAGCEIIRLAVLNEPAAEAIVNIKKNIHIPIIADIHFDHRLALRSIEAGVDGLRINPGNIGAEWKIRELVSACKDNNIPIRIGVNAGSLEKVFLEKYGGVCKEAMVESALYHIKLLENMNFDNIKVSLKASSVLLTIEAYKMMAQENNYPLHLGITEAGTMERALIKSSLGIGLLLYEGIGDTIRISLTADPVHEVWAAYEILRMLGLRKHGIELISCPTCGRCQIDLIELAKEVDNRVRTIPHPLKIAVMGCVVNGPGEAREADVGLAGGKECGLIFRKGEIIRKVPENEMLESLMQEINQIIENQK
jgi:(E)-4-hydroxy-3-methylbut-2-enyl-diphosphate synthase